jgi:MarR family 2-MHQ and catechol resistance regulon transcriptional repressor
MFLLRETECTVAETAEKMRFTPRYTNSLVNDLVKHGFVDKYKSEYGASAAYLKITQKGVALLDENRLKIQNYIFCGVKRLLDKNGRLKLLESYKFINRTYADVYESTMYKRTQDDNIDADGDEYSDRLFYEINVYVYFINNIIFDKRHGNEQTQEFITDTCLSAIHGCGPISMSDLAKITFIALDTLSKTITRLVERGVVERFQQSGDRRVYYVRLTENGSKSLDDDLAVFTAFLRNIFNNLLEEDKKTLIDSMAFVTDALIKF